MNENDNTNIKINTQLSEHDKNTTLATLQLGNIATTNFPSMRIKKVDIHELDANEHQTRLAYRSLDDKEAINSADIIKLAENIEKYGLQQPIAVYEDRETKRYQVIFGHRRVLAYKYLDQEQQKIPERIQILKEELQQDDIDQKDKQEKIDQLKKLEAKNKQQGKYQSIDAILHDSNMEVIGEVIKEENSQSPKKTIYFDRSLILNIMENFSREDLNIIEKAKLYEDLAKAIHEKTEVTEKSENEGADKRKKTETETYRHVARLLNIDIKRIWEAKKVKNNLNEKIQKEIMKKNGPNDKKIKKDVIVLTRLSTIKDHEAQYEIWRKFQDKDLNREDVINLINEKNEEFKYGDLIWALDNKTKSDKKSKSDEKMKVLWDNQGIKIRSEDLLVLTQKPANNSEREYKIKKQYELKEVIAETINNFLKAMKKEGAKDEENENKGVNNAEI